MERLKQIMFLRAKKETPVSHFEINKDLCNLYQEWAGTVQISEEDARTLSPPLLIEVPPSYPNAQRRIFFLGQETFGWGWTSGLSAEYKMYPPYIYSDLSNLADFLENDDGIEALTWGYREFNFAEKQPITHRAPFWRAFREVQKWGNVRVVWDNLSRCDYDGGSIFKAPQTVRTMLINTARLLLTREIEIIRPDACLFFSGPNYDDYLSSIFSEIVIQPVDDLPVRQFARLIHPDLPVLSFRTYHPRYLSQGGHWGLLTKLKQIIMS